MFEHANELLPFIEPGIIYGIGALGLAFIFRYLRFPDFTVLGSITTGGIATVFFTNLLGPVSGILIGSLSGFLLGLTTGYLASQLRIKPILAGIITYTASFSIAYMLSDGGEIALDMKLDNLLQSGYNHIDLLWLISAATLICIALATFMTTRWGALLFAMTADKAFVTFRHRYHQRVFVFTTAFGNAIVAFAGGLHAINDVGASIPAHMDFLPIALGGIFSGNAVTALAAKYIYEYRPASISDATAPQDPGVIARLVATIFSVDREDSGRIVILLVTYVVGCLMFMLISRSVQANIFFSIPSDLQYIVVAILMAGFVAWAGSNDDGPTSE